MLKPTTSGPAQGKLPQSAGLNTLTALFASVLMAACGGGGSPAPAPAAASPTPSATAPAGTGGTNGGGSNVNTPAPSPGSTPAPAPTAVTPAAGPVSPGTSVFSLVPMKACEGRVTSEDRDAYRCFAGTTVYGTVGFSTEVCAFSVDDAGLVTYRDSKTYEQFQALTQTDDLYFAHIKVSTDGHYLVQWEQAHAGTQLNTWLEYEGATVTKFEVTYQPAGKDPTTCVIKRAV